ncbi:MAG: Ig-like domain-containing protein [Clostridia bacterium]|nr:Ig-like domain-containing protein [Clostridia bacterium]
MLKKLTAKTLSLILAVMMLVSLVPLSASAATVKVSETFGGFSAEQLATTYTSTNQFTTASVTAPDATVGVARTGATPKKDADGTEYIRIAPVEAGSITGGISISNAELNVGAAEGQNNVLTFSTNIRKASSTGDLYFKLVDSNGTAYNYFRIWRSSQRLDYYNTAGSSSQVVTSSNRNINPAVGVWYNITTTYNVKTSTMILKVKGGAIDETVTINDMRAVSGTITGVMIGWESNAAVDAGWDFDIASMSLSNIGSTSAITKDELLFENSTLGSHAAAMGNNAWTSGNWTIEKWMFNSGYSKNITEVVSTGDGHGDVIKLTGEANNPYRMNYTPSTALTGKVVIESAFKDAGNGDGQVRLYLQDSAGTGKDVLYPWDTTGHTYAFNGPIKNEAYQVVQPETTDWLRIRLIVDLDADTGELSYWSEANPTDIVTYTTNPEAADNYIAALTDIKFIRFSPYGKNADTLLYFDNPSVSTGSVTLFAEEAAPANNATKVPVSVKPEIAFNAPVKVAEIFTLTDEDGATVAGTAGLTADGCGLAFYPAEELKPATSYTLTANGTVTDVFGDTAAVNETITFTTDDVITVNDVVFGGAISEGALVAGDLTATVDITSCDGAARDILVLMGLYDSVTKELKDFDVKYLNTADYDETLTVTVPAAGSYYPVVYVWNNYSSLKPYVAPITLD